jgi:hypothetical protein
MLRVTSEEVRIYPLVNLQGDGKKSHFVGRITDALASEAEWK